jgi:glycosyltransferase involved in cell wall biosynthesis
LLCREGRAGYDRRFQIERVVTNTFVVVPVYNEGTGLPALVARVSRYVPATNIVVIDDGSIPRVERESVTPAKVLRHRINLGKGMALKTGCEYAIQKKADAIVLMDGDGQHEPAEIPRLIDALQEVDIVFAARKLGQDMPSVRRMGNRVLNRSARWLYDVDLQDIWCGYRAFRSDCFSKISWNAHDYSVDVEMAIRAVRHRLSYREVGIETIYHDAYKGVTVVDGLQLLLRLVRWKFVL